MTSSAPTIIRLVGSAGGVADAAAGSFTVVVRDLANNPVPGASVVVDFSGCPDVTICPDQLDPDPGELVNLTAKTLRKSPAGMGRPRSRSWEGVSGAGTPWSFSRGAVVSKQQAPSGDVKIYGNGALIGWPNFAIYDLDGSRSLGPADLSVWLTISPAARRSPAPT